MEEVTITTTIKTGKVETTGFFSAGPMEDATIQVWTAKRRCRDTRMKPHSRTKWELVREDANDG
eukprot:12631910-Ditylum_brightwellii.AAC.1